jgi:hypothetical protein
MATKFELNYEWLFELNITPETTATWKRIAAGIETWSLDNNEELDQKAYLDMNGGKKSTAIAFQSILTFEGDRVVGDSFQDYVLSLMYDVGSAPETQFRMTDPEGNVTTSNCDIIKPSNTGGNAGEKTGFSVEIHCEGKPSTVDHSVATALVAVVATGAVVGATKFTVASPTAGASLRYQLKAASAGTVYGGQYFNAGDSYTSGADIMAAVGQYLCMYEVDANKHIVKYAEHVLLTADVNPGT